MGAWLASDPLAEQRLELGPLDESGRELSSEEGLPESKAVSPPRQAPAERGDGSAKVRCPEGLLDPPGKKHSPFFST